MIDDLHYLLGFCTSEDQSAAFSSVDEQQLQKDELPKNEPFPSGAQGSEKCETLDHALDKNPSAISSKDLCVLLCCKDSLRIYPAKSVVQVSLLFLIFLLFDVVFL